MPAQPRSGSFGISGLVHGTILLWVAFGPPPAAPEPRGNIYDELIKPHENRIVWYNLKDRLPDVSPAATAKKLVAPRAGRKAPQAIVAGARDDARPPQLIWVPEPQLETPKPVPLPNVLAVAPPKPLRPFTPPPTREIPQQNPALTEAPQAALPAAATQRAPLRQWTPPAPAPVRKADPAIPEAPAASVPAARNTMPALGAADRRTISRPWTPPASVTVANPAGTMMGEAPSASLPRTQNALPVVRVWNPPAPTPARTASPTITEAPAAVVPSAQSSLPDLGAANRPALRRPWTPPAPVTPATRTGLPALSDAPSVPLPTHQPQDTTLAIVGLNPAAASDFPPPTASRSAGFSAGPEIQSGGEAAGDSILVVPGLYTRGASKDSSPTLVAGVLPLPRRDVMSAVRSMPKSIAPSEPEVATGIRVSSAPDPRLAGRMVYSIAIQMPNITSYYGSWMVWFAESGTSGAGPVRAPVPLRKVDPKYIAAAASEKVEGVVRLFAVIRKDGRVDSVTLIRHLDDRLDHSAAEALAKWQFEPALRNGVPVDVDAVFEIPFRLAPRSAK